MTFTLGPSRQVDTSAPINYNPPPPSPHNEHETIASLIADYSFQPTIPDGIVSPPAWQVGVRSVLSTCVPEEFDPPVFSDPIDPVANIAEYSYEPIAAVQSVDAITWSSRVNDAWEAIMVRPHDASRLFDTFPAVFYQATAKVSFQSNASFSELVAAGSAALHRYRTPHELLHTLDWHGVTVPLQMFVQMLALAKTDSELRGLAVTMYTSPKLRHFLLYPKPGEDLIDCLTRETGNYQNAMRIYVILMAQFASNRQDALKFCEANPHRERLMVAWHLIYSDASPLIESFDLRAHSQCRPTTGCCVYDFDLLAEPQRTLVANSVNGAFNRSKAIDDLVDHLMRVYHYEITADKVYAAVKGLVAPVATVLPSAAAALPPARQMRPSAPPAPSAAAAAPAGARPSWHGLSPMAAAAAPAQRIPGSVTVIVSPHSGAPLQSTSVSFASATQALAAAITTATAGASPAVKTVTPIVKAPADPGSKEAAAEAAAAAVAAAAPAGAPSAVKTVTPIVRPPPAA